jgi:4-alpha-glucanotransferase
MASGRPALRALARRLGVEDGYRSALDGRWVATGDATREALVGAMGFGAASERAARASLARLDDAVAGPESGRPGAAPPAGPAQRPVFGIVANLYSLRSRHNWGFGNLSDLEALVGRAAREGAAFVGVNPLHAGLARPGGFCPYAPVSRLFRDPLYLDALQVPELARCPGVRRQLASSDWQRRLDALRRAERLDVAAVDALLGEALRPLHAAFRSAEGDAAEARRADFRRYREREGPALVDFATFEALADRQEAAGAGRSSDAWPEALARADAPAVRDFRAAHPERVEWHAWLQFELDRQLARVAATARAAGLPIGLYTDLALGSRAGGSDVWAFPELFARGVSVGAPPDAFSPEGQDWSFPPLDPHALRRDGCAFWRRLLEANLRHAGALRIDHAMALRRLFWIPRGASPHEGAYVRYPSADLLAVLVEVGRARGALLIAEDLGTVPEAFSEELRAHGLLSSRVLLFERGPEGFRPAADYPVGCLATANTHDLAPLRALDSELDLALRRRAGQIRDDAELARCVAERRRERGQLVARLVQDGWLDAGGPATPDELAAAVTAFLCATPARLVGVALDDLAGEDEPINLPGVSAERHESWVRRMRTPLERIFELPRARAMLARVPAERREPASLESPHARPH